MLEIIEKATLKFGDVVEVQGRVLLIKRPSNSFLEKVGRFMTIKWGENENGIAFDDGHYDMNLAEATESLYKRAESVTRLNSLNLQLRPVHNTYLIVGRVCGGENYVRFVVATSIEEAEHKFEIFVRENDDEPDRDLHIEHSAITNDIHPII